MNTVTILDIVSSEVPKNVEVFSEGDILKYTSCFQTFEWRPNKGDIIIIKDVEVLRNDIFYGCIVRNVKTEHYSPAKISYKRLHKHDIEYLGNISKL